MNDNINVAIIMPRDGAEEIESIAPIDLIRRAGIELIIAGETKEISTARNVKIIADKLISDISETLFDCVILPGGKNGVEKLLKNDAIIEILKRHFSHNKLVAAICAAPLVLKKAGIIDKGAPVSAHPSIKEEFSDFHYSEEKVSKYKNIITAKAAGASLEFAFEIIAYLKGEEIAKKIASDICYY